MASPFPGRVAAAGKGAHAAVAAGGMAGGGGMNDWVSPRGGRQRGGAASCIDVVLISALLRGAATDPRWSTLISRALETAWQCQIPPGDLAAEPQRGVSGVTSEGVRWEGDRGQRVQLIGSGGS